MWWGTCVIGHCLGPGASGESRAPACRSGSWWRGTSTCPGLMFLACFLSFSLPLPMLGKARGRSIGVGGGLARCIASPPVGPCTPLGSICGGSSAQGSRLSVGPHARRRLTDRRLLFGVKTCAARHQDICLVQRKDAPALSNIKTSAS
jgi:hypothetical protein